MSYDNFALFYDELMTEADYPQMAARLSQLIEQYRPGSRIVADIACGTGTLTDLMQKYGYDMIGIDGSPDMLMKAREKCSSEVLLLCQDMLDIDLYGTIDAAVCTMDSINHVTDRNAVARIFKNVSLFLEDNGIFVFDVNTCYKHEKVLDNSTFVYETDKVFCVWQNEREGLLVNISLDFFEEDDGCYYRTSECFSELAYTDEDIRDMLMQAELEVIGIYDGYEPNPLTETSQRALYVTKRKCR